MDKETAQVLKSIADKLDMPVERLWNGLIAYAPFEYYQWIAYAALFAVAVLILFPFCFYAWKRVHAADSSDTPWIPACILSGVFGVFFFLIGTITTVRNMPDALAAKHAPEAWATKYVLQRFR